MALAAADSGHDIVGVLSRNSDDRFGPPLTPGESLPPADLALICVRDDQIESAVAQLSSLVSSVSVVAHVSGFTPVSVLDPLLSDGVSVGGFHPLQTLPDPERGSVALAGSYAGIGGTDHAREVLTDFARSLEMRPFYLDDGDRPLYHAASAAAANFVVASLSTASDLLDAAGLDPEIARPLVDRVVSNVFEGGGEHALTGPIARGDVKTVAGQLDAARAVSDQVGEQFRLLAEATAVLAGRHHEVPEWR